MQRLAKYRMIVDGVTVEFRREDGSVGGEWFKPWHTITGETFFGIGAQLDPRPRLCLIYGGPGRGEACKKSGEGLPCQDGSTDYTIRTRCGRRIASRWSGAASWNWNSPRRPERGWRRPRPGSPEGDPSASWSGRAATEETA